MDKSTSAPDSKPQTTSTSAASGGVNVAGDQVTIGGDVVGRDKITSYIRNIKIDLRLLPVVIVLLVVIGVLSYLVLRPTRPAKMTKEFNVAVTIVGALDSSGALISSDDGHAIGDFIYQRLDTQFRELGLQSVNYELWPPDYTGQVEGRTSDEREMAAQQLADDINADVIIYGVLKPNGDRSEFAPEYYVNYKGFQQSPELTGQHALGRELRVTVPFKFDNVADVDNPALSARAGALSLITIGLAYYSIDKFEQALDYFQRAEQVEGWLKTAGKEIVYLLIGNAEVRLASQQKSRQPLEAAAQAYRTALDINSEFARAQAGYASTLYLQAFTDPISITRATIDQTKLDEAERAYAETRTLKDAAPTANIPTKVDFGLGQIYDLRTQIGLDGEWIDRARAAYQNVIDGYDHGNASVGELAGQAHERLGYLAAVFDHEYATAVEHYQSAIKLVTPFYQAKFNAKLGEVYLLANDKPKAIESYTEAVRIAEFYGDADSAEQYDRRLKEISQ